MRDFAISDNPQVQAQLDRLGALSLPSGRIGLAVIHELLDRLGNPQRDLPPVFHVAGTNGKGSTCAYLRAIGHNLHDMATRIVADWTDPDRGERRMVEAIADGGSELYDSADEYTAQLLKSLHTQLLAIRDLKFDRPLGEDLDHARPHRAEFWRSTRALRNIRHNLHAVRALYDAIRPAITDATLAEAIQADFEHAEAALAAIDTPLSEAVADPAHRPQVEAARAAIDTLAERVGKELPAALGLALGFNSLDGD